MNIAGYPRLFRQFRQLFHLFGGVRTTTYGDAFLAGGNGTSSTYAYDARLLPSQIILSRTGMPNERLAIQTRNVAGLVTKRRTNTTGAMNFVESNWTYDQLGRIASQVVQKGPGPTQVVRQDLTYFGNDDPKTLTHYLGTTPRQFQFGYDSRHQVTSATAAAGYFTANYSYGLGGRFTRATEAQTIAPLPAGTEVKQRDVNYVYGGADPEQVTALTNVGNGQTYASYTYDDAGNQITRTYPSTNESWDYLYDGKDQLRRATRKRNGVVQGSEEYWYDNDGRRIAIIKRNAAGAKTELIWFIGDTQAHYNAAAAVTHVYSHLSIGTPVARVDRTSNTATAVEYQFHGLASNTIAAVAQNGTINASFSYAPFGEVVEATNAGAATAGIAAHKRRFNDKYVDDLSDLTYYGIRFYDKRLMGWTQGDPLFRFAPEMAWAQPRRANLYSSSLQNHLRYIDPDGREPSPLREAYRRYLGSLSEQEATRRREQYSAEEEAAAEAYYRAKQLEIERLAREDKPIESMGIPLLKGSLLADLIYERFFEGRDKPVDQPTGGKKEVEPGTDDKGDDYSALGGDDFPRGPGGGRKHTPNLRSDKATAKRNKKRMNKKQEKAKDAAAKRLERLQKIWKDMTPEARKIYTKQYGGFEGWAATQL